MQTIGLAHDCEWDPSSSVTGSFLVYILVITLLYVPILSLLCTC